MSIIGKTMGIAQKNNAQLYEHNGLTPTLHSLCVCCDVHIMRAYN